MRFLVAGLPASRKIASSESGWAGEVRRRDARETRGISMVHRDVIGIITKCASKHIKRRWKGSAGDLRGRSRKLWRSRIRDTTFQEWKNDKSKALNGMRTSIVNT